MFELTEKDLKRFWNKVQVGTEDECWPWLASTINGYGKFSAACGRGKGEGHEKIIASRLSCFLAHGAAPDGNPHSLHSCDNPPCCNPKHLRWGTPKQNRLDSKERKRDSKPPVNYKGRHTGKMPKGNEVWNSELNEQIVKEIWRLHMDGNNTTIIAHAVGKTVTCVYDVCRGKSWRHVDGAPSIDELKKGGVRRGFNQFTQNR